MRIYSNWVPVIAISAISVVPAFAHEQGDVLLRAGIAPVMPNDDSGAIEINGAALSGTGVEVKEATRLGITAAYLLTDQIAIELLASTPFTHDIKGKGVGINNIAKATHLPPTLSIQYLPPAWGQLQAYVGIGVNYTLFFDEETRGEFDAAFGPSDIELDDSVGIAAEIGFDYPISDQFFVNASVWYMDIDTTAKISTATEGAERIEVDVEIDPVAVMLGLTYKM